MDIQDFFRLRKGEVVIKVVSFSNKPEVWKYINYPGFVKTHNDMSFQFCSSSGRLLRNNGEIAIIFPVTLLAMVIKESG